MVSEKEKQFNLRLSETMFDLLTEVAAQLDIPKNQLVTDALRQYLGNVSAGVDFQDVLTRLEKVEAELFAFSRERFELVPSSSDRHPELEQAWDEFEIMTGLMPTLKNGQLILSGWNLGEIDLSDRANWVTLVNLLKLASSRFPFRPLPKTIEEAEMERAFKLNGFEND